MCKKDEQDWCFHNRSSYAVIGDLQNGKFQSVMLWGFSYVQDPVSDSSHAQKYQLDLEIDLLTSS